MIDCKTYAQIRKENIRDQIQNCVKVPGVAVIQIGNDAASNSYIKGKERDCSEVGINFSKIRFEENEVATNDVIDVINELNHRNDIDGILVQLPLPGSFDVEVIQKAIATEKDVDGFRRDSQFEPCTPKGIIDWLEYNDFKLEGKNAAVVGRSDIVGKPLVKMLIDKRATVTCCNSKTPDIRYYTQNADLVITAIGKPNFFDYSYFSNRNRIIIDVGINRINGHLCGDTDISSVTREYQNVYVTPVPGGVGLLTRTALLENILLAYKMKEGKIDD